MDQFIFNLLCLLATLFAWLFSCPYTNQTSTNEMKQLSILFFKMFRLDGQKVLNLYSSKFDNRI